MNYLQPCDVKSLKDDEDQTSMISTGKTLLKLRESRGRYYEDEVDGVASDYII